MYAAWLDDFASRGVTSVGFGVLTLQRPATEREPFVDLDDVAGPVVGPMGGHRPGRAEGADLAGRAR